MYAVSDRFLTALAESFTPVTEVKLFRTDGLVETLDSELVSGSVTVARGQQSRRTCSVSFEDPALIPRTPADKLSAYGALLRISCGVQLGDFRELVPVGVFRIESIDGDVDDGPAVIQGESLEGMVARDKFVAPYRATGTAVTAITALIQRTLPAAAVLNQATDASIGARTWDVDGDPWSAVTEIAAAIGAECYCDADGVFVIAELPDILTATPVWTISAGEGGVYIQASRGMSSDGVYNGVLARGENTAANSAPVESLVVDNDPGSPTYWSGPFGHRPTVYSSSTLTTTGACTAAATLKLRSAMAPNATANLVSLANPALAAGDVVRVVYPDGTAELHQVAGFPIDLGGGADMAIQTISAKEGT